MLPYELADLKLVSAFRNPAGVEVKGFTVDHWEAAIYADLASTRFGEGPYFLAATWIPNDMLLPDYRVTIEQSIGIVVLSTDTLALLDTPDLLGALR